MKNNKGITLIALVITIIVMLILVVVSIQIVLNTGLFESAGKATDRTREEVGKEYEFTNIPENATVEDLIKKYRGEESKSNLPDDFFVYEDTEKTILKKINDKYLVKGTEIGTNNMKEGIKVASLKPIIIAGNSNGESPEASYYTVNYNGEKITKITIPEGVVKICENAFSYHLITEVVLPSTLTEIGNNAFSNCKTLEKVVIPSNVTKMGNGVFNHSTGNVYVSFISNKYRPNEWEDYWYASDEVDEHSDVKYATVNAEGIFKYADIDKTILIGIKDEYLVEDAEVTANDISKGIKVASLRTVKIAWYNGNYYHIKVNNETVKDLIIPEGVVEIETSAFAGLLIENVELPSTLRIIGNEAFSGCKILETIEIPSCVTTVGERVFRGSTGIVTVPFKDGERPSGWSSDWLDSYSEIAPTVQYAQ